MLFNSFYPLDKKERPFSYNTHCERTDHVSKQPVTSYDGITCKQQHVYRDRNDLDAWLLTRVAINRKHIIILKSSAVQSDVISHKKKLVVCSSLASRCTRLLKTSNKLVHSFSQSSPVEFILKSAIYKFCNLFLDVTLVLILKGQHLKWYWDFMLSFFSSSQQVVYQNNYHHWR